MMRTANPVLSAKTFSRIQQVAQGEAMTIQGTVNKTAVLLAILVVTSSWVWGRVQAGGLPYGLMVVGGLGGWGGRLSFGWRRRGRCSRKQ
ncbi:MAG: Bax inhibitor-1/YccA family protein [Gemmatimonadetes bacterium]|nr:Bax inhibitor-1/YccA family protein [Gemmatimonadota bacterium]